MIVIGGLGFIGGAVVDILKQRGVVHVLDIHGKQEDCDERFGHDVTHHKCDIMDIDSLRKLFDGHQEVYNFAGMLGTSELDSRLIDSVNANIIGALNVFQAAVDVGVKKVFYPSKPNVWLNAYTITKVASEQFGKLYNKKGNIKVVSLRLFNAFGPRQHLHPIRKMIPHFLLYAINGLPVEVYGSGEQTVDLIYVDDVARLSVEMMDKGVTEIVEGGRGVALTVNEVANKIARIFDVEVRHLPMREGEDMDTKLVADVSGIRNHFPDFKFSDFEESLWKTIDYYTWLPDEVQDVALKFYGK